MRTLTIQESHGFSRGSVNVDAAEYETREIPKVVDFKVGDRVRHRDKPYYGTGVVEEISKSGKSVYVRWGDDWDRRRLIEHPYGGYFRPDKLVRIP